MRNVTVSALIIVSSSAGRFCRDVTTVPAAPNRSRTVGRHSIELTCVS